MLPMNMVTWTNCRTEKQKMEEKKKKKAYGWKLPPITEVQHKVIYCKLALIYFK